MNIHVTLSPINQKKMKKLYGKNLAREIAVGRKLVKMMSKYATPRKNNTL